MSRAARDWAWSCRGLTLAVRCTLLALAEHADEEGRCWPSLSRLAALTEADRRTVTRGLAALKARGLLARERRPGRGTTYRLAIGRPGAEVLPTEPPDPPDREVSSARPTANPPRRGTSLHQGCDTPGGRTPQGARDPYSRGVTPLDLGASGPPNRHKSGHRTDSEPSSCADGTAHAEKPTGNDAREAIPIPPDWRPGGRVFDWAAKRGLSRTWVEAQLGEFLLYWGDTGECRKSWDATYINRLQALQANQPKDPIHEPEPRLADKDYRSGATPLDQIPWLDPAALR